MTDAPICGFYQNLVGVCRDDRDGALRCTEHGKTRYMVCVGCAGQAHRECDHIGGKLFCGMALCMSCQHLPDGSHAAPNTAPSAAQEPPAADAATHVREQLLDALTRSLEGCAERSLVALPTPEHARRVAGVLLDDLSAYALLGLLGGMAAKGGV